jgi:DNA repair exonuclease SbcCD ATPase subunit
LSACINKEEANVVEKYKLKEEEIKYKGYLSPIQTKTFELEVSKLRVSNGDNVAAGDVLTELDQKVKEEINRLTKEKQQTEAELGQIDQKLSDIKKGNYSISSELTSEVETLKESIKSQAIMIQELELNLEETKSNYEMEKNNYNRKLNQNKTDINTLNVKIQKLKSSNQDINLVADEIATVENEIKLLDRDNKEIEASLASLEQTYKFNETRISQSLQSAKENKATYEGKYNNIVTGNTQDPSVKVIVLQLEEEKNVKQENINEINKTITATQEESLVVAPFDGQIIIAAGQVVLQGTSYQFVFEATENQVDEVKVLQNLQLQYKAKMVGNLTFNSIKYNEEISVKGQAPIYSMFYDINATSDYKPMRSSTAYMVFKQGITIPEEYLGKTENKYYVLIGGKKKLVKIEKLNNQYIVIEGAKKGDIIEKVVNG